MNISKDRALDSEAYLLFYVKQGSAPWFSTLLKRKKNVSSDSDEGSYSCSDSDDDEEENDGSPETSYWYSKCYSFFLIMQQKTGNLPTQVADTTTLFL
jgi:hypothetical protein